MNSPAAPGNATASDVVRVRILQLSILAATLAWSLNLVSFLEVKEAALWIGVAALWLVNTLAGRGVVAGFRALAPCWIILLFFAGLGGVTATVPAFTLYEGLRLLPLLLLATLAFDLLHHPLHRRAVLRAIVAAAFCSALLALLQLVGAIPGLFPRFAQYDQSMYSVFGNEGLLAGYLAIGLTCLPGTMGRERGFTLTGIALLLLLTLLLTESRGGLAAALAGFTALLILRVLPSRALVACLFGFGILVFAIYFIGGFAPWEKWLGLFGEGDTGGNLRHWLVRGSLGLITDDPVWGCGLGNYAYALPRWLGNLAPDGGRGANTLTNYHAHFDLLEWLAETGLAGLLAILWMLSRLHRCFPVALCGLTAALAFSMTHPAFYSAPHAIAALLLYTMNVRTESPVMAPSARSTSEGLAQIAGLLLVLGGGAVFATTVFYPSFLLRRAEDRHLAGDMARADYERAIRSWGFHPEAHESYGIYCYEHGDYSEALQQFHRARQGIDTGRIYELLAMTSEALKNGEACHWYRECTARWPWDLGIQIRQAACCEKAGRAAGVPVTGQ
jgi:O-antigen ligase